MQTRVRFRDGTEDIGTWFGERPASALTAAVTLAERHHDGEPHDGAWLEFLPEENES